MRLSYPSAQLTISLLGFAFAAGMLWAGKLSAEASVALIGSICGYWMPSPATGWSAGPRRRAPSPADAARAEQEERGGV